MPFLQESVRGSLLATFPLFQDRICHSQTLSSLQWMRCIGKVRADQTSHYIKDYNRASMRESEFYLGVAFQYLLPNFRPGTMIFISHPDIFQQCKASFHSHPDYQSSSISIHKQYCIQSKKGFTKLSECRDIQKI